jgi:cyanophycinase
MAKGILIPIGGAEDKGTDLEAGIIDRNRLNFFEIGILKKVISLINIPNPKIEVITTASTIPDELS